MSFRISLQRIYLVRKEGKTIFVEWVWTKKLLTMNPMEKITKMNTTSKNMKYLVGSKKILCQHNKLQPLTARIGKWISETMY